MSFITLILLLIVVMPLVFVLFYWLAGKITQRRSIKHFLIVCFVPPLAMLLFALWLTNVPAPSIEEHQLIAEGQIADPGPASFVMLLLFGILPMAIYLPLSGLAYWLWGRVARK